MPFYLKFFYSIAKPNRYHQMIDEGVGRAFLYLLLFSIIFGTVQGYIIASDINAGVREFSQEIESNLPPFTLANGELDVEGEMPIVLGEDETSIFIVDDTGATTPDVLDNYESGILFLKDRAINKRNHFEIREYRFSNMGDVTITKDTVVTWLPYLKWIGPFIGVLVFIFFFIAKLFSSLLLGLVGLIISSIQKVKLSFSILYSIAIYSLTFPVILDTFLPLAGIGFPWYIYYGIAIIYMLTVINHEKKVQIIE